MEEITTEQETQAGEYYKLFLALSMLAGVFPDPHETFMAGVAAGLLIAEGAACPVCAEREQLESEAQEGLRTAMEIVFEGR